MKACIYSGAKYTFPFYIILNNGFQVLRAPYYVINKIFVFLETLIILKVEVFIDILGVYVYIVYSPLRVGFQ